MNDRENKNLKKKKIEKRTVEKRHNRTKKKLVFCVIYLTFQSF